MEPENDIQQKARHQRTQTCKDRQGKVDETSKTLEKVEEKIENFLSKNYVKPMKPLRIWQNITKLKTPSKFKS